MINIAINYNSLADLNIGDYIQSLAAKQYFNDDGLVYCERDELNHYHGGEGKLIYNCWFTAKPDNFPPSKDISPLFRSFHLNSGIADKVLSIASNVEYFKKYEPIGCRDINSAEVFLSYGVDAYFSGCLTTTLGNKFKFTGIRKGIYVVDLISTYPAAKSKLELQFEIFIVLIFSLLNISAIKSVYRNLMANNPLSKGGLKTKIKRWLYCSRTFKICKSLFSKNDMSNIVFITHLHDANDILGTEARFERAEELLNLYKKAELVLSSRIHCILPCLGLDTPSIYFDQVNDHPLSSCRKKGLIELFNVISLDKTKVVQNNFGLLSRPISIQNPPLFREYSEVLSRDCYSFMEEGS